MALYTETNGTFTLANGQRMNKGMFSTYLKATEKQAAQLDAAVLFTLAEVAEQKHNTQAINSLLKTSLARYKNGNLKQLGTQLKAYFETATSGICSFTDNRFKLKKDRDYQSLDTMLEKTGGLFSDYQNTLAEERAAAKAKAESEKAEQTAEARAAREAYVTADAEAKKAEKEAAKAEAKAKAIANKDKAEAAKIEAAKAEAEAAKAEAMIKAEAAEAAKAEAEAKAEQTKRERFSAMPKMPSGQLTSALERALYSGVEIDRAELASLLDLIEQVKATIVSEVAGEQLPEVEAVAADMVYSVKPSAASKAAH